MEYQFINICGLGFVGGSVSYLCRKNSTAYSGYDIVLKNDSDAVAIYNDIKQLISNSEQNNDVNFYFICVPTPMGIEGECNTTIVEKVVGQLFAHHQKQTIVLIKSTVQPGTCRKLFERYSNNLFKIAFVPEFLTERRANLDMYEAKFAMIGTHDGKENDHITNLMKRLYKHNSALECITRKYEACEIFKYTINCFLGVKVWFFNEVYELCEKFNIEYDQLRHLLPLDPRIGMSHTLVPGPDGGFGFSGTCIPKDLSGFQYLQNQLDIPNTVLSDIFKRNKEIRKKPVPPSNIRNF